jgi:Transposase
LPAPRPARPAARGRRRGRSRHRGSRHPRAARPGPRAARRRQDPGQVAAALGLARQLTGRFWRAPAAEALLAGCGTSAAAPYLPYLRQRWDEGITTISKLHEEITAPGYRGSTYAATAILKLAALARPPAPPTPRQVTRLLLRDPAHMDPAGLARLRDARALCPEIDARAGRIAGFGKIITQQLAGELGTWIAAITADPAQPELRSFITGLHQDIDAVRNALTQTWSSRLVEGLNTRTKAIMRAMYGRATLSLLRKRILLRRRMAL